MKKLTFSILVAALLWTIMFSPFTAAYVNFWVMMTISAAILCTLASLFNPRWWRDMEWSFGNIVFGVAIGVALWGMFWIGDKVSSWMFDFARDQVDMIYGIKEGESPWVLSTLMLFLIGPTEEIFWRGYVQKTLSRYLNPNMGFVAATLCYTLIHLASWNFMLVMAALVAGVVWGGLYRLFPDKLAALVISHSLWDVAVFIWFPI